MQYQDIVGQDEIKFYLREAIRGDRLPHALLFLGSAGHGSLPMALATAQYLMCQNRTGDDACGQCSDCHKAGKFIHPDIHFSFPTIGSKVTSVEQLPEWRRFLMESPYGNVEDWLTIIGGENKQGNINKDECHRILKALSLKTYEGDYKIHILWMAEYLGKEGNRLLKIIEEPPNQTIFLIIAANQDEILNTILSRCQLVSFSALSDHDITEYLMTTYSDLERNEALHLTYLADGDLGSALSQLHQKSDLATDFFLEWMRTTFKGNPVEIVQWVDRFARLDREGQKRFLSYALHFLREMLLRKVSGNNEVRLLGEEKKALEKLKTLVPLSSLQQMIELLGESIFHLERNANSRILMLDNSIRMHNFFTADKKVMAN